MADVSSLRQQLQRRAARAQVLAANEMRTAYRRAAPHGKGPGAGATLASVDVVNFTTGAQRLTCTAVATTPQAKYTDEGTKPHTIRAKNKQALRFRYRGRIVIVKSVQHPGNKATHWFSSLGKREWGPQLQRAFRNLG